MAGRADASRQMNAGLAMIAAGMYPGRTPGGAGALANVMNSGISDPGAIMGNLVRLQQYKQQQDAYGSFLKAAPEIAQQWGVSPNEVMAVGPDAAKVFLQSKIPPEMARNYIFLQDQYAQTHQSDPDPTNPGQKIGLDGARKQFQQDNPPTMMLMPNLDPDLTQMRMEGAQWQRENPGEPLPDEYRDTATWKANKQAILQKKQTQSAAADAFPGYEKAMMDMRTKAATLADPRNQADVQSLLANPTAVNAIRQGGYAASVAQKFGVTSNEIDLLHTMDDLANYNVKGISAAGPRESQDINTIQQNLGPVNRLTGGYDEYSRNVGSLISNIDDARANARGASGQLSLLTPDMEGRVDPSYLPGGSNFLGIAKKIDPATLAQAQAAIAKGANKADVIRRLKVEGYDTRVLGA